MLKLLKYCDQEQHVEKRVYVTNGSPGRNQCHKLKVGTEAENIGSLACFQDHGQISFLEGLNLTA